MSKKILTKSEQGLTGSGLDTKKTLPPYGHYWVGRMASQSLRPTEFTVYGLGECWEEGQVVWIQFSSCLWKASLWTHPEKIIEAIKKQKDAELKDLFDASH